MIRISNSRYTFAFSRRDLPEVCVSSSLERRGSRECRMRAAPAVSCGKLCKRKRTRAYRAAEAIRHSLRNGFTAYTALSPEYRAFLPPSPHGNWHVGPVGLFAPPQDLTPTTEASGPHDFAVRFSTARQHILGSLTEFIPPCDPIARTMPPRPPQSHPNVRDDGQRPFLRDRMA